MTIGDGIFIPAISVLSATGGIKVNNPQMSSDTVVIVSVLILVGLFSMLFAPIVFIWLLFIGGTGLYNICIYDTSVLKAFSRTYVYMYFRRRLGFAWRNSSQHNTLLHSYSLPLSSFFSNSSLNASSKIVGTEALYDDIAYFPLLAIQLAFTFFVFPCLLLAYCGQAAYLVKNKDNYANAFYESIPDSIYWPMCIVATGAAIVGSQATISGTYSIIKQSVAHGCFPQVKVVHTSKKFLGQIYSPDINWILMVGCIAVTARFKNQNQIGNAYGTAVAVVMLVTTVLMVLLMLLVWRCHWLLILVFTVLSLVVEGAYFSAVLLKVNQGGWLPLVIAAVLLVVMLVWNYVKIKRYEFQVHSKVSMSWIIGLGPSLGLVRVPGIGIVYSELASGIPHIFSHVITNLPPHQSREVLINNNDMDMFSSMVDYTVSTLDTIISLDEEEETNELEFLKNGRDLGVVHIQGNTVVKARRNSSLPKKIMFMRFLKRFVEGTTSSSMFLMSPF